MIDFVVGKSCVSDGMAFLFEKECSVIIFGYVRIMPKNVEKSMFFERLWTL